MKKSVSYNHTRTQSLLHSYRMRIAKKVIRRTKQFTKILLLSPLFHGACKIFSVALMVIVVGYGSYYVIGKTFANEVVVSQSQIINNVRALTYVPHNAPYDIVRVQDEDDLRRQNPFFSMAKAGDYIIVYSTMMIIYDLRNNTIVAKKEMESR